MLEELCCECRVPDDSSRWVSDQQIDLVGMAMRIAARYVSRRLSSSGKILSEEEKAAENVYIKVNHEIVSIFPPSFRSVLRGLLICNRNLFILKSLRKIHSCKNYYFTFNFI